MTPVAGIYGGFYSRIAEMFPKLAFLIYHNPAHHQVKIPVSVFGLVKCSNIVGMKDSHRDTREFLRLMEIIRGKISVMTNQAQCSLLSHGLGGLLVDRRLDGAVAGANL